MNLDIARFDSTEIVLTKTKLARKQYQQRRVRRTGKEGKNKIQQYSKDNFTFRAFYLPLSKEGLRFMTHDDKQPHVCANPEQHR